MLTNEERLIETARKTVFADLGIEISGDVPFDGEYHDHGTFAISPSMCGPLAFMYSRIQVSLQLGYDLHRAIAYFAYRFRWDHVGGGSNGQDVRKYVSL